jgi:hypothetical protein
VASSLQSSFIGGSSGFSTCGRTLTFLEENNQLDNNREGEIEIYFWHHFVCPFEESIQTATRFFSYKCEAE